MTKIQRARENKRGLFLQISDSGQKSKEATAIGSEGFENKRVQGAEENVEIIDAKSTHLFELPIKYVRIFQELGSTKLIENATTEMNLVRVDDVILPFTVNDCFNGSSYVCSIFNQYVTYAMEEIDRNLPWGLSHIIKIIPTLLGGFFRLFSVDRTVMVNNWMLSTNLYPTLTVDQIKRLKDFFIKKFPDHCLIFRSIDESGSPSLAEKAKKAELTLILSRQVYLADPEKIQKENSRSLQRDRKICKTHPLQRISSDQISGKDYERIIELYNQLYLGKYSQNNPKFTAQFLEYCHRNKLIEVAALSFEGKIVAALAYVENSKYMTSPIFGYDFEVPHSWGLYRQLMVFQIEIAARINKNLHLSSGAAGFKRARGAKGCLEYNAVFYQHLQWFRRWPWFLLEVVSNTIAIPVVRMFKL